MTYGPIAAYMGELFAPNVRYSAASLAYQLAAITVSGGTPFIMTALIAKTGTTTWVAVFVALMGLVTFFSAWVLKRPTRRKFGTIRTQFRARTCTPSNSFGFEQTPAIGHR
ncbi:hypothetical protein ACQGFJ_24335 [Rhodococcus sp. 3.70]